MRKPSKSVLKTLLWVAVVGVAVNVVLTLQAADAGALTRLLELSPWVGLALMGLALVHWITHALRMGIWARFFGHHISFRHRVQIAMGTQVGASVSPSAIGGEPLKVGMLMNAGLPSEKALTVTLLNLFEDLLFFGLAFPLVLISSPLPGLLGEWGGRVPLPGPEWLLLLPVAGIALAILGRALWRRRTSWRFLRLLARLRSWLRRKYEEFAAIWRLIIRSGRRPFLLAFALTLIQWTIRYNLATLLVLAWGEPLSAFVTFQFTLAVFLAMFFVPTPGAALGAEGVFYALFSMVLPPDRAAVLTVSWRFLSFYLPLAAGALGVLAIQLYDRYRGSDSGGIPVSGASPKPGEPYRRTG